MFLSCKIQQGWIQHFKSQSLVSSVTKIYEEEEEEEGAKVSLHLRDEAEQIEDNVFNHRLVKFVSVFVSFNAKHTVT